MRRICIFVPAVTSTGGPAFDATANPRSRRTAQRDATGDQLHTEPSAYERPGRRSMPAALRS
jgi:hypothetical protein